MFDFGNISKIDKANRAANITKSTILFKGNDTIISSPKISLITKDSSSFFSYRWIRRCIIRYMWKLSRQGMKSHYAAAAASWIHNEIGLDAGPGLIAEDMNKFISKIMSKKLKRIYENGN